MVMRMANLVTVAGCLQSLKRNRDLEILAGADISRFDPVLD